MENYHDIKVLFADKTHLKYAQDISDAIAQAAQDKKSGLAHRDPDYIAEKIESGKGVIALDGDSFAGFCYIETWEHNLFVANSGLIVKPEYRGRGLAKAIKAKAFELSTIKYPGARIFGLTTSPAVKKINLSLGYKEVPYTQITRDIDFWKGCFTCCHYDTLCKNGFSDCFCSGMVYERECKEGKKEK